MIYLNIHEWIVDINVGGHMKETIQQLEEVRTKIDGIIHELENGMEEKLVKTGGVGQVFRVVLKREVGLLYLLVNYLHKRVSTFESNPLGLKHV